MEIKDVVKEKYGQAALRVQSGKSSGCGPRSALDGCDPITSNLYDALQTGTLPEEAVLASLGCGNPTALAQLHEGETVLDLGSGGGIDVKFRRSLDNGHIQPVGADSKGSSRLLLGVKFCGKSKTGFSAG